MKEKLTKDHLEVMEQVTAGKADLREKDAEFITSVINTIMKNGWVSDKQWACVAKMQGIIENGYPEPTRNQLDDGILLA